jgi:type II secretory pathway component PulM
MPPQNAKWQTPLLFAFGVIFLSVLLWLVFKNPRLSHDQCIVVKVILGLAAAGVGAILPGKIFVKFAGIANATGAAAFFFLVFWKYDCPPRSRTRATTAKARRLRANLAQRRQRRESVCDQCKARAKLPW